VLIYNYTYTMKNMTPDFTKGSVPIRENYKSDTFIHEDTKVLDSNNLKNLKYIKPKDVLRAIDQINNLPEEDIQNRELVIGIGTGGTISMKKNPDTGLLEPDMDFDSILEQAGA